MRGASFLPSWTKVVNVAAKYVRRFYLRRLLRHYSRATQRPFDRQASARLDAILFLVESENSERGES